MHGLKIYTSNHMEILAERLAQIVREPLSSPFSPEIIVVQSRGKRLSLFRAGVWNVGFLWSSPDIMAFVQTAVSPFQMYF